MCIITMDTHSRDIVANMHREGVDGPSHFMWQSQLKYRWDVEKDDCAPDP